MSETETAATATEKAKRTYTRRTTRDKVVDLLEEAIRLVKARCVEPDKSTKVARDLLAESKREFAEAVELKKQANALQTATALSASESAEVETEAAPSLKTKTSVPTATAPKNTTLKVKKGPSCPGGPKAFNEFLKSKRAEVEAELGDQAPYSEVRAKISQMWKETCSSGSKRTSRKKTPATAARVNAPVSLPVLSALPEVSESKETEAEAEAEEVQENLLTPVQEQEQEQEQTQDYEDLGVDDMFGMRKVKVDGRDLYMSDNKGLFIRNDEDDDPLGEFVGYLRNGKIVEQNAPNS